MEEENAAAAPINLGTNEDNNGITSSSAASSSIKKPVKHNKSRRRYRRRPGQDVEEDENEEEEEEEKESEQYLSSLKQIQRQRQKKRGIEVDALLQGPSQNASGAPAEHTEEAERKKKQEEEEKEMPQYGLQDMKQSKKKRREAIGKFLGGQFTAQTMSDVTGLGSATLADLDNNPHMKAYVEERMKEYRRQRGEDTEEEQEQQPQEKPKDPAEEEVGDLYELPEHLKPPNKSSSNAEESGEGAPLFLNTGLAEVELPEEVKRKNVEETEQAKREYIRRMKQQQEQQNVLSSLANVGGSVTANYKQHRKEYAEKLNAENNYPKSENTKQQHHEPSQQQSERQHARASKSTDEMVLNRFKKAAWGKR
eukprot:gb/GECG01012473.1/.p1 GENE.gb/GECG01012473.1/~~gb/GECG01012473.1/.p1  ORF type:complete len:366 (+),score=104.97 gb/GECG01012473.1/:1-1098(+)